MLNEKPEHDLEESLDIYWDHEESLLQEGQTDAICSKSYAEVPIYVLEDAIERLKRYEVIVENLTKVGNYLWMENLRKYGSRRIHAKETPNGSLGDSVYQNMSAFVNRIGDNITIEDAYVELALSASRISSGDPTGLSKYQDKEEELFERLDGDE